MYKKLITSEYVSNGHPDKVADQISDAIVDAYITQDPNAKVACETLISKGLIVLAGEVSSDAKVNVQEIVRKTLSDLYTMPDNGFDYHSCGIIESFNQQSADLQDAVKKGASDQCIVFGYATDETASFMPLAFTCARTICNELGRARSDHNFSFLMPDAKVLVCSYNGSIHSIVVSTQHKENIAIDELREKLKPFVQKILPQNLFTQETQIHINPAGRFVIGGPTADTGLTGRKQMVDSYGCTAHHGGGAFSGKDPSKIDRSGAYLARYIAKNIIASALAKRCEVQLAYAIGMSLPVGISIDTFNTATVSEDALIDAVVQIFDLSAKGMIEMLNLKRPIYYKTAKLGHFGIQDPDYSWERIDKAAALRAVFC